MKFQEGDKIVVVATGEQGVVIEWINKKMLTIEVDGIQFPVYADQIDFPYFDAFTKKKPAEVKHPSRKEIPKKEKKIEKKIELDGLHLSFFPILDKDEFDENIFSHYRVFLLNHTNDELLVSFTVYFEQKKELETKHQIAGLNDMYLFDLSFDQLNDQPKFVFDFSLVHPQKEKASHYEVYFKPKPRQFLTLSEETIRAHQASFKFLLYEHYPGKEMEVIAQQEKPADVPLPEGGIDLSLLAKAGFKISSKK
jgi:hypothetical protein